MRKSSPRGRTSWVSLWLEEMEDRLLLSAASAVEPSALLEPPAEDQAADLGADDLDPGMGTASSRPRRPRSARPTLPGHDAAGGMHTALRDAHAPSEYTAPASATGPSAPSAGGGVGSSSAVGGHGAAGGAEPPSAVLVSAFLATLA